VFFELLPLLGDLQGSAQRELEQSIVQQTVINFLRSKLVETSLPGSDRYWIVKALSVHNNRKRKTDYVKNLVIPQFPPTLYFPNKAVQI
jgi:hypothetical protein